MTMSIVFEEEKTERIRSILPDWVEVYKVVVDDKFGGFQSPFSNIDYYSFGNGFQVSEMPPKIDKCLYYSAYLLGYHFHAKKSIDPFRGWHNERKLKYLKCFVHKSWITSIGLDTYSTYCTGNLIFVAPFAIFPIYPATEANLNDYLESEIKQPVKKYASLEQALKEAGEPK